MEFDPQGKYLYVVAASSGDSFLKVLQPDSNHVLQDTNQTQTFTSLGQFQIAKAFAFKNNGAGLIVSGDYGQSKDYMDVFERDCGTGALTRNSETMLPNSLFVGAPLNGSLVLGWGFFEPTPGAELINFNQQNNSLTPVSLFPSIFFAAADHAGDFVATTELAQPNVSSPLSFLSVYRIDPNTPGLTRTDTVDLSSPNNQNNPVFNVSFDFTDNFIYVPLLQGVAVFRLNHSTGKLTQVPGSPFPAPVGLYPATVVARP